MAKRKRSILERVLDQYPATIIDDDLKFILSHPMFRIDMMKYISLWYSSDTPSKIRRFKIWVLKYYTGGSERKMKVLFGRDKVAYINYIFDRRSKRKNCKEYYLVRGFSEEESMIEVSKSQENINHKSKDKRVTSWLETWNSKSPEEIKLINEKKSYGQSLEAYIKKYGEEDGIIKYQKLIKSKGNNSVESIISRGFSKEEAASIKSEINMKQSKRTRKGIHFWLDYCNNDSVAKVRHREYLNTLGNFSYDYCIEKYGKEKGLEVFNKRQEKWQKTLNSKSDEEISEINRKKHYKQGNGSRFEKDVCDYLKQYLDITTQFQIKISTRNWKFYDIKYGNKIIECNGDFWHLNPSIYKGTDTNPYFKGKTANDIWLSDKEKVKIAENAGYEVLVVWEKEYKENKDYILEKALKFLLN